jgi:hypothetical protein
MNKVVLELFFLNISLQLLKFHGALVIELLVPITTMKIEEGIDA